jgi:tetratricopeptide (TPR) repeat protein
VKKTAVILVFIFVFATNALAYQTLKDTLTRAQFINSQTIKSDTLNQMALKLAIPGASNHDLNEAINLIMKGLHNYSRFRDSVGLRQTFDNLAFVYHLQKKHVQAKWFYIQSNTLARQMSDTANIIHSLLALSSVKADIKDYAMANRDLQEAKALSRSQKGIDAQIEVQNTLATYYTNKGDTKKAALATERIAFIKDSVNRPIVQVQPVVVETKKAIVNTNKTPVKPNNYNGIITQICIIAALLIVLLICYVVYKRNSRK